MNEEDIIKEFYIKYWKYMIDKNVEGLRMLMADDYYLCKK